MKWNTKFTIYTVIGFMYQSYVYGILEYSTQFSLFISHILFWPVFFVINNILIIFTVMFFLFNIFLVMKYIDFKAWAEMICEFYIASKVLIKNKIKMEKI